MKTLIRAIVTKTVISVDKALIDLDTMSNVVRGKWNCFFIWDKPPNICCFVL